MCVGNVEVWLGQLLKSQRHSLHGLIRMCSQFINDQEFNLLQYLNEAIAQVRMLRAGERTGKYVQVCNDCFCIVDLHTGRHNSIFSLRVVRCLAYRTLCSLWQFTTARYRFRVSIISLRDEGAGNIYTAPSNYKRAVMGQFDALIK